MVLLQGLALLAFAAGGAKSNRLLPAHTGATLDGQSLSISSLMGKRLLILVFDAKHSDGKAAAAAIGEIAPYRSEHNFEIVGVARGGGAAYMLAEELAFDFPVFEDNELALARKLGATQPAALFLADAKGVMQRGGPIQTGGQPADKAKAGIARVMRDWLRLPQEEAFGAAGLEAKPAAPDFTAKTLDGKTTFELAKAKGRPVLLVFFLHTCPHCHEALRFYQEEFENLPEDGRPLFVGLSLRSDRSAVEASLASEGIRFFSPYGDPDGKIREAFGGLSSVPTSFLIDAEGRIHSRVEGWRHHREPALQKMRLAQVSGRRVPMLLNGKGYSGNEICVTCHEQQHDTWLLTNHASAYDTLVKHGAETDPECVGCHVVGYGETGGYSLDRPNPGLEDVGCESCHGRGGPHLSKDFVENNNYAPVCVTCHDTKHSLGFDYTSFVPKVSHAANAAFAALSVEEKKALIAKRRETRAALLPTKADYVGSDACQSCHAAEFDTWAKHPHAKAFETLVSRGEEGNAACVSCHTTAYDKAGGFPANGSMADHPDLARVGCESCHGPGGDHVPPEAAKKGTILALTDKCDSCVILQICGGCHDDANDPGFEFEVEEKIEHQRHGTVGSARLDPPASVDQTIEHAFRQLDGERP